MSAAIETLRRELVAQQEKLAAVEAEHKQTIEAGQRALSVVNAQKNHVNQLQQGIAVLERDERGLLENQKEARS